MHKSRFCTIGAVLVVAGLAVALSACGGGDDDAGGSGKGTGITIANFEFSPSSVKAGSTVTVANNDSVTHTVTADDDTSFDVTVDAGKTATFTAPAAGKYALHCNIHDTMKATLTVT